MDNLKKLNFTELNSSEMKQVQGGGAINDLIAEVAQATEEGIVPAGQALGRALGKLFGSLF